MIAQIDAFPRNRFDQSSAQAEFCTYISLNFFSIFSTNMFYRSRALLNGFLRIFVDYNWRPDAQIRRNQCLLLFEIEQSPVYLQLCQVP